MAGSLHGFRVGECVIVYHPSMRQRSDWAAVIGPAEGGQIEIRYEGKDQPAFVVDASSVFHDTPAFGRYLDVEFPHGGLTPTAAMRTAALKALHADNRHLRPNIADVA